MEKLLISSGKRTGKQKQVLKIDSFCKACLFRAAYPLEYLFTNKKKTIFYLYFSPFRPTEYAGVMETNFLHEIEFTQAYPKPSFSHCQNGKTFLYSILHEIERYLDITNPFLTN